MKNVQKVLDSLQWWELGLRIYPEKRDTGVIWVAKIIREDDCTTYKLHRGSPMLETTCYATGSNARIALAHLNRTVKDLV